MLESTKEPMPHNRGNTFFFQGILLAICIFTFIPLNPGFPEGGLDPSWMSAINQAVEQGLVFGRDIVFTFGPFASIYTKVYHPATDKLMIWGSAYLAITFFTVTGVYFQNKSTLIKITLILAILFACNSRDALFFFHILLIGLYFCEDFSKSKYIASTIKTIIISSALGLYPIIKGSTIPAIALIMAICTAVLITDRRYLTATAFAISPIILSLLAWALARQPIAGYIDYLGSIAEIIDGYSNSMSLTGNGSEIPIYIVGSTLIMYIYIRAQPKFSLHAASRLIVLFIVLYSCFKAGFVRHDIHGLIAAAGIFCASIACANSDSGLKRYLPIAIGLTCAILIAKNYTTISMAHAYELLSNNIRNAGQGAWMRTFDHSQLKRKYDSQLALLKTRVPLPQLNGTVDIYSFDQTYLIASGNKWNPRPIFQSYSAYTPILSKKNATKLESESGANSIFFSLQPIDYRLPSLEDSSSWPILFTNYSLASRLKHHLLLSRKSKEELIDSPVAYSLKSTHQIGKPFHPEFSNDLIFIKIHITPTLKGYFQKILLNTPMLHLTLTTMGGEIRVYRFIPSMAEAGFLISPLVESNSDFAAIFSNAHTPKEKMIRSISIDEVGNGNSWNSEFTIETGFMKLPNEKAL